MYPDNPDVCKIIHIEIFKQKHMGYIFFGCNMGPLSPWCRIKDVIAALWPLGDLLSDGLATILYYDACYNEAENVENEAHLCIFFLLVLSSCVYLPL